MAAGRLRGVPGGSRLPGLWLLLLLLAWSARAQQQQPFNHTVTNLAASSGHLWVASGGCAHQLQPSLQGPPLKTLCGPSSDSINKLLLPFDGDRRLLTCWIQPRLQLSNCTQWQHHGGANWTGVSFGDQLVGNLPQACSVGQLYSEDGHWYLVVATSWNQGCSRVLVENKKSRSSTDGDAMPAISIKKDDAPYVEELQRWNLAQNNCLCFVDAFRWRDYFFFPYHHYNHSFVPAVAIMRPDKNDQHSVFSYGQTFLPCANGTQILSSSLLQLSQERAFWVGVFQVSMAYRTPTSSVLCIFEMTQVMKDAERCFLGDFVILNSKGGCEKRTLPIKSPSLSHSDLVSVYATVVLEKIVLFLGTRNGQLMKVILDENMEPSCPEILYEIEEPVVFHRLVLDPVDKDYIYLPSNKEVRRIQVANCSKYISCQDCLSAMDPYCGWCFSKKRCTLARDCLHSNQWANISYGTDKCLKVYVDRGEISVTTVGNFSGLSDQRSFCKVINTKTNKVLCENEALEIMNCSCLLNRPDLTGQVQILFISGSLNLSEVFELNHCSNYKTCSECDRAGCTWHARKNKCASSASACKQKNNCDAVTSVSDGKDTELGLKSLDIISIEPAWISTLGKSEVIVRGKNLSANLSDVWMEMAGASTCEPDDVHGMKVNDAYMKFCLPPSRIEAKSICIKAKGFNCSSPLTLYYVSLPMCFNITPSISWMSGGRSVTIHGRNLNVTDRVMISTEQGKNLTNFTCRQDECVFTSPLMTEKEATSANITLELEKKHVHCINLQYLPDPKFIRYYFVDDVGTELELKIHKENDNLNISINELKVFLSHMADDKWTNTTCTVPNITKTEAHTIIQCRPRWENKSAASKLDKSMLKVYVKVGNFGMWEVPKDSLKTSLLYILLLIPIVIAVAFFVTKRQSTQLNRKLSEHLELLECGLRKDIRDGFVELQMEKWDVVDSFGTIPFLDYKHFVLRAFFPECGTLSSVFIEDTSEPLSRNPDRNDESITALYTLICNKNFLITLIHTLEKQKSFSIKDRCFFASYLTIALQTNLVYLTHILEVLTKDLMDQSSNAQPKLLLRRTESVMEKLLTNWMSVCLSGFLRETVGEPFYLLVTTLNQRISRGPVDVITCKALYTLNEDWLLWQVPEFSTVALSVIFEKIPENENEDATQSMVVDVLDCDTIGQAKGKILQAFSSKNGSFYGLQLSEMGLALQSDAEIKELEDIDSSTIILEDGTTKLNTIGHYEISNGATVKVFRKKTDLLDHSDKEYPDNYCHLILPDSEAANITQGTKHKRKHKFKVKEMYLTKLLSTKIAVHSVVEKLFRSIWTLPNNRAPVAVKYFFDFLDAQAENKKITDPDVVHIWKTNSLPLRFWVNILKNPQFVFDMKKTPHIDGCLSVIAQAFMDAFSLSEQLLGKEAPTNKLLYAKDIPLYKEEVKAFYKAIKDLPSLKASELEEFLTQESKKHENEFNKAVALNKIYQYIARYFDEILNKLEKERGLEEAQRQLLNARALVDEKKKCKWISAEEFNDPQP